MIYFGFFVSLVHHPPFLWILSFFNSAETPSCWKRSLSRWPRLWVRCWTFSPLIIKHSQAVITLVRLHITFLSFFYFVFIYLFFLHVSPAIKVGCYVTLLISSVSPFFCSSSQQPENRELWRPCENFPGKNQRAKNLNRMPRVSMRTSRESEYLGDCVRGGFWNLGLHPI